MLPMAERATPAFAAQIALGMDRHGHTVVTFDEGVEADEGMPAALADRIGLHVTLDDIALGDLGDGYMAEEIAAARALLPDVAVPDAVRSALVGATLAFGLHGMRGALLAIRCARAAAALDGAAEVDETHAETALALVILPRATCMPRAQQDTPDQAPEDSRPPEAPQQDGTDGDGSAQPLLPEDMLIAAAQALLPADLLAQLAAGRKRAPKSAKGVGSGDGRRSNRRGRPLPSRPGKLDGQARLDLVATLRAAAPWQAIRRKAAPHRTGLIVHPDDIRLKRYEEKSDRLLIFSVDASGSAAMARLAEAKGAVELLLAEAYARRDTVALVAFRGTGADVLLPPTRSLVQTKRRLGALPGGGGTPLAAGLQAARLLAEQARGRGMTPSIALLTDGRANIALDGSADRRRAASDATDMARALRGEGIATLVIDTGARATPQLRDLAGTLDAPYLPLPRADAQRLSSAVNAALES
jgi:magnesium chelatase subunit D